MRRSRYFRRAFAFYFSLATALWFGHEAGFAQRQPTATYAICYSLEDLLEVLEQGSKPYSQSFKDFWDNKKAQGKCFFNLAKDGQQDPPFYIEDANVAEREYSMNGKKFRSIVVRGRIGSPQSGKVGYSFLQISY